MLSRSYLYWYRDDGSNEVVCFDSPYLGDVSKCALLALHLLIKADKCIVSILIWLFASKLSSGSISRISIHVCKGN